MTMQATVGLDPHDPLEHPDFLACNDPRLETKWEHPTVYVPSLVYMLHRLGGPANISDDFMSPSQITSESGTILAEVVMTKEADDGFSIFVGEWHRKDTFLTVVFDVPARWHFGGWMVNTVMSEDIFCASAD